MKARRIEKLADHGLPTASWTGRWMLTEGLPNSSGAEPTGLPDELGRLRVGLRPPPRASGFERSQALVDPVWILS